MFFGDPNKSPHPLVNGARATNIPDGQSKLPQRLPVALIYRCDAAVGLAVEHPRATP